jgi:hypothetical protein
MVSDLARSRSEQSEHKASESVEVVAARRTAFVARFIVLREGKRTKAHRTIELMSWSNVTSAEHLAQLFADAFRVNGDRTGPVERDIRRALAHANRSLKYFITEYSKRSTLSFIDALHDYERSNILLFGNDEQPRPGGWRLARELAKDREKLLLNSKK